MLNIVARVDVRRNLSLSTKIIGAVGENLSRTIVVTVPADLELFQCRVEFADPNGVLFYMYTTNSRIDIPEEWLTAPGNGMLQIVMVDSNGVVVAKSTEAAVTINPSVNAIDETDPAYQSGLDQVRGAAFASAVEDGPDIVFYNMAGVEVGRVTGGGGGDTGAIVVADDCFFTDTTERDQFFIDNPSRLIDKVYCVIGSGSTTILEQWWEDFASWFDMSAVVRGPKGDDGNDSTVPGPAGKGVESVDIDNQDHLIVTYTDGSTHDAGALPSGGGGGPAVVQSKGVSTSAVMSQKAVTDELEILQPKETGKGLSTNDYSDLDKTKLAGIQDGAINTATVNGIVTSAIQVAILDSWDGVY